jgi:hypothetical protein
VTLRATGDSDAIGHAAGSRRRTGLAVGVAGAVTLVALALLLPATGGKGPEMDEGAVVAYAARVLDGAVPHRDFLTFYGPGNPWFVAGAFEVFGATVGTERGVGLLYRLIIVLSLFALAWRVAGLLAGVLAGVVSTTMLTQELVWAYATYGAIAFGLLGLALMTMGVRARGRVGHAALFAAGVAGGMAVLIRFDFALAVIASALPLLALVTSRGRIWYAGGLLLSAGLYLPHLVMVGPERIGRVLDDLVASGPGRRLPIPRPWVEPGDMLALAVVGMALLMVLGALRWRRDRIDPTGRVLVAAGLFSAGVLPWTLSRADAFHVRPFALVPLSLLPAVALLLLHSVRLGPRARFVLPTAVAATTLLALADQRPLVEDRLHQLRGFADSYRGFYDDDSGMAARAVVDRAETLSTPGDSLFVGPQDLRRANYGPTYVYFLLRQLRPASYYMELNPMTANREGSGLADELRGADWLILTSEWDDWDEPNESSKLGPTEPNQVVRDDFCLRLERGQYRLYERCDRAA